MSLATCPPPPATDWVLVIVVAAVAAIVTVLTGAALWLAGMGLWARVARWVEGLGA